MRNTIRLTLALAVMLVGTAWSQAALADVFVTATIDKEKDIFETVSIFIDKFITVEVDFDEVLDGDAEAHTLINQTNTGNNVDGVTEGGGPLGFDIELDALLETSVTGNSGIVGVNQDVGNMVNQANAVSLAETVSETSITTSQAHAEQINTDNTVNEDEELTDLEGVPIEDPTGITPDQVDPDKTATIIGSINANAGIVGVNQNAGNNNNQANGVALAVGFGSHVALAEADLGQVNTNNIVESFETFHPNLIQDSVNDNSGIVQVNQTTGNNNNQGSMISFSALTTTIDITIPGSPGGS
jgi:hypothetical protein